MSGKIITVEKLAKRYIVGHQREGRDGLRHALEKALRNPFKWLLDYKNNLRTGREEFWALKDICFTVNEGDVVGVIGRNGAGKSTLLKILSRITEPTSGRVSIKGRVASLLEVGTGFHPELTGRENVFLNGAILGMPRAEIRRKFDEIVEFAEVERFLDTPVKRYSSGMYVRLAFAVAAHLEPEILIVDEVLAVGDATFQKKCLGKMGEVANKEGRTVMFVSHNMQAVSGLCKRAILLDGGVIRSDGRVTDVVGEYLTTTLTNGIEQNQRVWKDAETSPGNDSIRIHRISVLPENGDQGQGISMATPLNISIEYWNLVPGTRVVLNLDIYSIDGAEVFEDWTIEERNWGGQEFPQGFFKTTCRIPGNLLNAGTYRLRVLFFEFESTKHLFDLKEAFFFSVTDTCERPILWHGRFKGFVHPKLEWSTALIYSGLNAPQNTLQ
jgi:lipopolysaccharide transport system ATP-binding protein